MSEEIELRRGTAAQWTAANPTLGNGEPGFETDTLKFKIGNGTTAWNSLAYEVGSGGGAGSPTHDAGNLGAAYTLDLSVYPAGIIGTLNANCTITLTNRTAGAEPVLLLTQTAAYSLTISDGAATQPVGSVALLPPGGFMPIVIYCPNSVDINIAVPVSGSSIAAASGLSVQNVTSATAFILPANVLASVDTTPGSMIIPLPTAPPDGTQAGAMMLVQGLDDGSPPTPSTVTVNTTGTDTFADGSTSSEIDYPETTDHLGLLRKRQRVVCELVVHAPARP